MGHCCVGSFRIWAIGFLLNYLKIKDVTLFVIWRLVVALLVFAVSFLRGETPKPSDLASKPENRRSRIQNHPFEAIKMAS